MRKAEISPFSNETYNRRTRWNLPLSRTCLLFSRCSRILVSATLRSEEKGRKGVQKLPPFRPPTVDGTGRAATSPPPSGAPCPSEPWRRWERRRNSLAYLRLSEKWEFFAVFGGRIPAVCNFCQPLALRPNCDRRTAPSPAGSGLSGTRGPAPASPTQPPGPYVAGLLLVCCGFCCTFNACLTTM